MNEQSLQQLAAQLRRPTGQEGINTGDWMNRGNTQMNLDTLKIVDAVSNDSVLEIGMGNGFFVHQIVEKHPSIKYTGADFSEVMVAEAQRLNATWINNGQVTFILTDAAALPFGNCSFNKIFTINTIYFWEDALKILAEIKRVLLQKGKLIIALRPKRLMQNYPFTKYGFTMFTKQDVVQLLTQNGFTVARAIENPEPDFDLKGEIIKMENLIVVAVKE
jgi:ubiquinone/menaquinone biosynthesis C-methylase UbiE